MIGDKFCAFIEIPLLILAAGLAVIMAVVVYLILSGTLLISKLKGKRAGKIAAKGNNDDNTILLLHME